MIHFFTYYSVGGYKDMYLGNNTQTNIRRYYLPLLQSEEKEAAESNNIAFKQKVERQLGLHRIELLSDNNRYGLPDIVTSNITAHGGYNIIYTHIEHEKHIIAVRGIKGKDKDDSGRPIPYLMLFMCDEADDLTQMNRLAGYISQNMATAKAEMSKCLFFDATENGLCFEQAEMIKWIDSVTRNPLNESVSLVGNRTLFLKAAKDQISLLVTPEGINSKEIVNTISLGKKADIVLSEQQILPKDDPDKAQQYQAQWEAYRRKKIRLYRYATYAAIALVFVFFVLIKCTGKSD